jgi:hypothetical protein
MVNFVDIPILQNRLAVLIIGIILGSLLLSFINKNYPSLLSCNSTEKFTNNTYKEYNAPLINETNKINSLPLPFTEYRLDNAPVPQFGTNSGIMNVSGTISTDTAMAVQQAHAQKMALQQAMSDQQAMAVQQAQAMAVKQAHAMAVQQAQVPIGFLSNNDEYASVPSVMTRPVLVPSVMTRPVVVPSTNIPIPNNIDHSYEPVVPTQPVVVPSVMTQPVVVPSVMTQPVVVPSVMTRPVIVPSTNVPIPNNIDDSYEPVIPTQPVVKSQPMVSSKPVVLSNFNTSWCGWSKKFQPEWDVFMTIVKSDNTLNSLVDVRNVNCDNDDNKQLCIDNNVDGYPTVIMNVIGKITKYDGPRTSEALIKSVKQIVGSM